MLFSKFAFVSSFMAVALAVPASLEQREISNAVLAASSRVASVTNDYKSVFDSYPKAGATSGQTQSLLSSLDAVVSAVNNLSGAVSANPTKFTVSEGKTVITGLDELARYASSKNYNTYDILDPSNDGSPAIRRKYVSFQSATDSVIQALNAKSEFNGAITLQVAWDFQSFFSVILKAH